MRRLTTLAVFTILLIGPRPGLAQTCDVFEQYMQWAGEAHFPGNSFDVAIRGSHAYVANWLEGVRTFDISDPEFLQNLGLVASPSGYAQGLCIVGSLLYLADGWGGLAIYSLANPALPVLLGSESVDGYSEAVSVSGTLAAVPVNSTGLRIMDISNPAAPLQRGLVTLAVAPWDVDTQGSLAYVAAAWSGESYLYVIDFTNPDVPILISALSTPGFATAVKVQGTVAYVSSGSAGLLAIDVANPLAPVIIGSVETIDTALDVELEGALALVMIGDGVQAVDITEPAAMQPLGHTRTAGNSRGIDIMGQHAFVADDANLLSVIDYMHLHSPAVQGQLHMHEDLLDVAVCGDLTCVSSFYYMEYEHTVLYLIAVADPANPTLLGFYSGYGYPRDMLLTEAHAYYCTETQVAAVDVSDPTAPFLAGSYTSEPWVNAKALAIAGDILYVASSATGLLALDVGESANMLLASELLLPGGAQELALWDYLAYVADGNGALWVVDVSDPEAPFPLGSTPLLSTATLGMATDGGLLLVLDGSNTIQIFDLATPAAPLLLSTRMLRSNSINAWDYGDLALSGDYAYVADGVGMLVLDLGTPSFPLIAGSLDPAPWSNGLALSETEVVLISEHFFVLPQHCGSLTAAPSPPPTAALPALSAWPNPFNPHLTLRFHLERASRLSLVVHDVSGRRVRHLLTDAFFEIGPHEIPWDGLDDAGRAQPSGVYLFRLDMEHGSAAVKGTLLR